MGQNIDWFTGTPLALLHIRRSDGLRQLVLPLLGLGEYTLNSAGLACCLNGTAAMQPDLKPQLPLAAYLPRAMRQTDTAEARRLLEEACRGIVAVTLADSKGGLLCVESILDDYEVLMPEDDMLVHANNYLTPRFQAVDGCRMIFPDSPDRTARMNELALSLKGRLTPQSLGEALEDHQGRPQFHLPPSRPGRASRPAGRIPGFVHDACPARESCWWPREIPAQTNMYATTFEVGHRGGPNRSCDEFRHSLQVDWNNGAPGASERRAESM